MSNDYLLKNFLLGGEGVAIYGDEEVLADGLLNIEGFGNGRCDLAEILVLLPQGSREWELKVRHRNWHSGHL